MDSTAKKEHYTAMVRNCAVETHPDGDGDWCITGFRVGSRGGGDWLDGDLFIRLIRMIAAPLVFVTIVSGVVSMGDPSKLGSLGAKTLVLYMLTTLAAITIGLILAVFLQPGVGVDLTGAPASP